MKIKDIFHHRVEFLRQQDLADLYKLFDFSNQIGVDFPARTFLPCSFKKSVLKNQFIQVKTIQTSCVEDTFGLGQTIGKILEDITSLNIGILAVPDSGKTTLCQGIKLQIAEEVLACQLYNQDGEADSDNKYYEVRKHRKGSYVRHGDFAGIELNDPTIPHLGGDSISLIEHPYSDQLIHCDLVVWMSKGEKYSKYRNVDLFVNRSSDHFAYMIKNLGCLDEKPIMQQASESTTDNSVHNSAHVLLP